MDFDERSRLVRRICCGKLRTSTTYNNQEIQVIFQDPSLEILSEADYTYEQFYNENKDDGDFITLEESYQLLIDKGEWSEKHDLDLSISKANLRRLKDDLKHLQFQKARARAVKKLIDEEKEKISQLEQKKNQLYTYTLEFITDKVKKRFIIKNITQLENKNLLDNENFVNKLILLYYRENLISEEVLREISRTDPWRLYWSLGKDTGNLFNRPAIDITDWQYLLVTWSKIYDFSFESMNRPTKEVIEDNNKFDAWYEDECERLEKELSKSSMEKSIGANRLSGNEIFIPADAEGAKEVYALNDPVTRRKIQKRTALIKEKGAIRDQDLPDVRQNIQMEANKLAMEQTKQRSK